MSESEDYFEPVHVEGTFAANYVSDRDPGVRLYCTQSRSAWALQLRGSRTLSNGRAGKDFMIVTASLSKEELRGLRDAIDRQIAASE